MPWAVPIGGFGTAVAQEAQLRRTITAQIRITVFMGFVFILFPLSFLVRLAE
jgi:hypothetical protein